MQNLLLIPFRTLFRTAAERGRHAGRRACSALQHGYLNNGGVWFPTTKALVGDGLPACSRATSRRSRRSTPWGRNWRRVLTSAGSHWCRAPDTGGTAWGGLVCRAYLRSFGGDKVEALVTMGSPHHGTFHAFVANGEKRPSDAAGQRVVARTQRSGRAGAVHQHLQRARYGDLAAGFIGDAGSKQCTHFGDRSREHARRRAGSRCPAGAGRLHAREASASNRFRL